MPNSIVQMLLKQVSALSKQVSDYSDRLVKIEERMEWAMWGIRAILGGVVVVIIQNWLRK